ncbi:hypothetical protein [Cyanobium sp. Lug-B]|uniref:hypothetical protein n=1 Tax=Cyanobium sp. Lug-B TaxID=2823716 RepID=UPI0020CFE3D1|nr:hypothetical protein [Cyanobium sp. Lug-B]MCP9798911.1 hypothetical protein [Cyanobium sp. Lug-B]
MNTKPDTITVLLAVALEVAEAVLVLTVALVALVLTVARAIRRRAAHPAAVPQQPPAAAGSACRVVPAAPAPAPAVHPLAVLAAELEALPVSRLRPLAGVTSKRHRKIELISMVAACC